MAQEAVAGPRTRAWLVWRSGPLAGTRHALGEAVTRLGRSPENDIIVRGPDAAIVSLQHAEIARDGGGFRLRDLGSTNGTFLNGERVTEVELRAPAVIRLGPQGPELGFVVEESGTAELDRTLVIPEGIALASAAAAPATPPAGEYEVMLTEAVVRARQARSEGFGDQTFLIMRDALDRALRRTSRRFRAAIAALVLALIAVCGFGWYKIAALKQEKRSIDHQIDNIETRLQKAANSPAEMDRLVQELNRYQDEAEQLQHTLLYRVGVHENEGFLTHEIRVLMAEFGAEVYSIPPEFTDRVAHYIAQYQGPDRPLMEAALGSAAKRVGVMREVLTEQQLPPDLAYIPLVESALERGTQSAAGAAGPWQFTAATARAYGLRVDGTTDERFDLRKSTLAGCRYLRELILDFGAGSSVMLALAAYDLGPSKVKQAILKTVRDPIKQRNFWYLYRTRALPAETREYVPKVLAAVLIGKNPGKFGFATERGTGDAGQGTGN